MNGANYEVTKTYMKFIYENFDVNNHVFLIIDKKSKVPIELMEYPNLILLEAKNNGSKLILNYMKKYNRIILHSLFIDRKLQLQLMLQPSVMAKIYWVDWGMDLYQWKKKDQGSILLKYTNLISYLFRFKIKNFVGIFPPDIKFFKEEFRSKANTYYASYVGGLYNCAYYNNYECISLQQKKDDHKCINIQIGHQSNPILNHDKVLEDLKKYKEEDIKIFLPLNYGDMKHGYHVMRKAKSIFGDKVVIIRRKMSKEDYMEFLSTIDIAIFNTDRQIGLGNIMPLMYWGKKIFMPSSSVMYKFFQLHNIDISDYSKITDMNYGDFIRSVDMSGGKRYIETNIMDKDKLIKMWSKVFR
jgi:hypothetical protein